MGRLTKVLVANRGEIAVRVIRACRDAGLASVAVYADPDRDAPFVRLADEAFALGGTTAAESYLDIAKVIDAAEKAGADGIHPGYGFLSENADFAQAVIDAGITWIGPSPQSIRDLGDKVTARHIAMRAGAPLVPGTADPVSGADEVVAFAGEHGPPVAIQAAQLLSVNPRTFAIAVALSASVSMITPFEPASLLVYGAGKYRFIDFVKTGGILTLILVAIILGFVPILWPL